MPGQTHSNARDNRSPEATVAARAPEEKWQALTLADYRARLNLTPEQVERLRPVFGVTGQKLRTLRSKTAEQVASLVREMNHQVISKLTVEQQAKLRELLQERERAKAER
jgi:hypothetical protein